MENPRQRSQGSPEGLPRIPNLREVDPGMDAARAEEIAGVKAEVTIVNGVLQRAPPGAGMETPRVDEESQIRAVNGGPVPRKVEEALQGPVNGMKVRDGQIVLREDESRNPEKRPRGPIVRNQEARIEVEALGRALILALKQQNNLLERGLLDRRRKRRT